ncbi:MAG: hypothetical protein KC609_26810 [Myxococcales bacterium]|nr:hypothetical protein [Myxococcales bacterium]
MLRTTCISLAIACALTVGGRDLAASRPKFKARTLRFDGFKLGDRYTALLRRAPYDQPCDNDPIDKRSRRFMVYGGLSCRGRSFPGQTTVMLYLAFSSQNRYDQPIVAFAYLHGHYFDKKTNFPLKPGDPLSKAWRYFSPRGQHPFTIARKGLTLTVHPQPGQIYIVTRGTRIVGFVFGPMPSNPTNEQWRGLMQMYQRYTPK